MSTRVERLAAIIARECDALSDAEHAELMRLVNTAWGIDAPISAVPEPFCAWSECLAVARRWGRAQAPRPVSFIVECAEVKA